MKLKLIISLDKNGKKRLVNDSTFFLENCTCVPQFPDKTLKNLNMMEKRGFKEGRELFPKL